MASTLATGTTPPRSRPEGQPTWSIATANGRVRVTAALGANAGQSGGTDR